jgi:glutathione synthase/RimK-type ligase-like ATP-grasp enzyme
VAQLSRFSMKIVIVAPDNDNHTAPITWALERVGYEVYCWPGLGWSAEHQASLSLQDELDVLLGTCELEAEDVVWIRRPEPPQSNPKVSEADRKFAQAEYRWFSDSLMYLFEMLPLRCVNKYSASRMIRNKAVQLALALGCGMNVPATLMANVPGSVRDYLRRYPSSICKPFFPHIWRSDGKGSVAVTETFKLTEEMLPSDEVLTYAPAIYQQMVAKQFDVRMVLLGDAVYSYALHNPNGSIDWRQDVTQGHVRVESIATPDAIQRRVLAFAEKSGIEFGSFDFGVDADGRWWFFEVNEQGQFLWLDDFNPELHLMEKFLAFLTSPQGTNQEEIEKRAAMFPSWKQYVQIPASNQQAATRPDATPDFVSRE